MQQGSLLTIAPAVELRLLAPGIAGWGAQADKGGLARSGTLREITLYYTTAGTVLISSAALAEGRGVGSFPGRS